MKLVFCNVFALEIKLQLAHFQIQQTISNYLELQTDLKLLVSRHNSIRQPIAIIITVSVDLSRKFSIGYVLIFLERNYIIFFVSGAFVGQLKQN